MFFRGERGEGEFNCGMHHPHMIHPHRTHGGIPVDIPRLGWDSPRRFMKPVVMLLLAEEPVHGYELVGRLKEFGIGQGGMDPSLLYRLLRSLERAGLTESTLDDSGSGPARKVYSLTPEGMEVLDMWVANLDEIGDFLHKFKERYEKLS